MTAREEVDRPPQVYRSASLQHAVELACQWKDEGRYDWFRGQVRHEPAHTSLFRRFISDPAEHQLAVRRTQWFKQWVKTTPQLAHLLDSEDLYALHAIAQHYGIPTNLLDFTTDPRVAGFFAADTIQPAQGCESCIYCLDTHSLERTWQHAKATRDRSGVRIEPIRIAVDNLWRLQAQRGVFLHANYDWEADYPMDRILFPYSGYPVAPNRSEIYPIDKSSLEILLDQYFDRERLLRMADEVGRFAATHAPGSTFHLIPAGPEPAGAAGTPVALAGSGRPVRRLVLSADGTQLAAVDGDGLVRWWALDRGVLLGSLSLGAADHVALAIDPRHGLRAVVAGRGDLWTAALPSHPVLRLLGDDELPIVALEMAAGGARFAAVRQGGVVEVWRWNRPDPVARIAGDEGNTILAISADGRHIARAGRTGDTVEVAWGRAYERRCSLASGQVAHLSFAPDGLALAVAGAVRAAEDRPMLAVCDGPNFGRMRALQVHLSAGIHCALSGDPMRVLSCAADGSAVVSSLDHGGSLREQEHAATQVMAWSPTHQRLARVNGSTVEIVDAALETVQRWDDAQFFPTNLVFSPDGAWLAAMQQTQFILSGQVRVWNVASGELAWRRDESALSVAWSPDGTELAVGLYGELVIWTCGSARVRHVALDKGPVRALAYSPDGTTLAVGIWRNQVWLIDTRDDTVRTKLAGHSASVIGLAFLERGRTLVSMSEKDPVLLRANHYKQKQSPEMIHWDLESAKELHRVELEEDVGIGTSLAVAPDASTFVTGHVDGSLCFWDPVVIRPRMKVQGHRTAVTSLAFGADGRTVSSSASADVDSLRHWQADEWRDSALLKGHKGAVVALAFAPDSRWFLSGSGYDGGEVMQPGEIFVWDPRTAERRTLFSEHDNAVEQLALAPDGRRSSHDCSAAWSRLRLRAALFAGGHGPARRRCATRRMAMC
jgi:WD40 repeat protein